MAPVRIDVHAWEVSRVAWPLLIAAIACHPPSSHQPLAPAGATGADQRPADDGAGELARWSSRLLTSDEPEPIAQPSQRPRRYRGQLGEASDWGGDSYGGAAYGGTAYANYRPPTWGYTTPNRNAHYSQVAGLVGAIEGNVAWAGAAPPKLATACGVIDNPSVRVTNRGVGGVLVYIEKVAVGRQIQNYGRPVTVGGSVIKRGCALLPAIQIATPLPVLLSIHGDAEHTKVKVTLPTGPVKPYDLQEGGRVQVQIPSGITRVEGEDGKLTSAWVLALDTPYYAITDEAGHFRLDELAEGTYDVMFWQPPIASSSADGRITYGPPVTVKKTVVVAGTKPGQIAVTLGR